MNITINEYNLASINTAGWLFTQAFAVTLVICSFKG
jgi:hypothetical protein